LLGGLHGELDTVHNIGSRTRTISAQDLRRIM
jgi:hypothetical protein